MKRVALVPLAFVVWSTAWLSGCAYSQHATVPSTVGAVRSSNDLLDVIDTPGPVTLETVDSADWQVQLSGLVNLDHPKAKSAGLVDGPEKIVVQFHVLRHPDKGVFIVDTGVEQHVHDAERASARGLLASEMKIAETLQLKRSLHAYLTEENVKLAGVLLTHLHFDHVWGMADVPKGTPIYAGPGETKPTALLNAVIAPNIDRMLAGHDAIREWPYAADSAGLFDGVLDIFGDGSVWALWVPGHTPGNTAYLVRTTTGPVLLTGDTSHTRWGWENGVEPGGFSLDAAQSAASFHKLRAFASAHPNVDVRLGHQH
jgi:N-acyl homoserine lactone hydrolase